MELFEAGHEIKYLDIRRVATAVILLGGTNDDVDDVGEATAAATAFLHRVIDLRRHDQLPTVLIEEGYDRILDVFFRDEIAAANQHVVLPVIRNVLNSLIKQKRIFIVNKKLREWKLYAD
ncbi:hypothetical protein J2Z19_003070 [Ensifer adhaerens]|uniref:Uncharacterized protein n=1 Tax=Ensifer adhaerens TaxID=106592 RepID=A0ACC5SX18_ENSAD|nr:hypothetical protein [Ensifer adhaerens]